MNVHVSPEVESCLGRNGAVVALESALITHGLPRPANLKAARDIEARVRDWGAVPATIGVVEGRVVVGLDPGEMEGLAESREARKVSLRDMAACAASGAGGGTTVAATAHVARLAGIRVFATGGIGGVHRGQPFDVSADLPVLAHTPLVVVCAGAKSILDLPLTLEWLETHGVPVVGYQTDQFPAFFTRESGLPVDFRADSVEQIADLARVHWRLGMESAVLVGVPPPKDAALPRQDVEEAIETAVESAEREGVRGKALTPYLLRYLAESTQGRTLSANLALLLRNAEVAARLAVVMARGLPPGAS